MPKLCLSMIVKNETHIIRECLESIYPHINYWVISDTGSTDGTQELIKTFFAEKGIPGELHEDEWKGFGHNRTQALRHCDGKAEYAWMIDADDKIDGDFKFPKEMVADGYVLRLGRPDFSWWRTQIFKIDSVWRYEGVLHEYPATNHPTPRLDKIEGNYYLNARTLGARNIGVTPVEKYKKDAELLEAEIIKEPTNSRYHFYLGQSYFDSQQWEKAIVAYQGRIALGGWPEEVYYSMYRIAVAKAMMDRPWPEIMMSFLEAYNYRPSRAEPLVHIAQVLRQKFNQPAAAFVFARQAVEIPFPATDILFIPTALYEFAALDEVSATAYAGGRPDIGYHFTKKLLLSGKVPDDQLPRIQNNLKQYEMIMQQITQNNVAMKQQIGQQQAQQQQMPSPQPPPSTLTKTKFKNRKIRSK